MSSCNNINTEDDKTKNIYKRLEVMLISILYF